LSSNLFLIMCAVLALPVFFFFQAEDGIRPFHVTGVQTCALPIFALAYPDRERWSSGRAGERAELDPRGEQLVDLVVAGVGVCGEIGRASCREREKLTYVHQD